MKKIYGFLMIMLIVLLLPVFALGANWTVTVGWDANTETDLAGYRLYGSQISGQYTFGSGNELIDVVVPDTQGTFTIADGTWHFVLTAYDASGNESVASAEILQILDSEAPNAPTGLKIIIIVKVE